jgi:hypothetical protein
MESRRERERCEKSAAVNWKSGSRGETLLGKENHNLAALMQQTPLRAVCSRNFNTVDLRKAKLAFNHEAQYHIRGIIRIIK